MSNIYYIHVHGHLGAHWSQWFDGLQITTMADGVSLLSGNLTDQAALFGVLARIRDLGLTLLAVERVNTVDGSAQTLAPPDLQASPHVAPDVQDT